MWGRVLRGGSWWAGDELVVNESILRWRRARVMLGTWGGERLRRKGGFRFGYESRRWLPLGGAINAGNVERMQAAGSLGVKEPAFFLYFRRQTRGRRLAGRQLQGRASADILESVGARGRRLAGRQLQGRLGRCRRQGRWRQRRRRPVGGWFWSTGRVGAWAPSRDFRNRASPTRQMWWRGSKEQAGGSGGYFLIPKKLLRSILGNYEHLSPLAR